MTCFKGPTNFPSPPRRRPGTDPAAWMTWDMLKWFVTTVFDPFAACVEGRLGGGIEEITSADDSVTVASPTGPITDLSVHTGYENLYSGTVTVPPSSGPPHVFTFTHQDGDTLVTNPVNKVIHSGVYAMMAQLFIFGLPPTTPNVTFDFAILPGTSLYNEAGKSIQPNAVKTFFEDTLNVTTYFDSTAPYNVEFDNNDSVPHDCACRLAVVKIGGNRGA